MFQDTQTKYLLAGPSMVLGFVFAGWLYEVILGEHTSRWHTAAETVEWVSPAVALSITILAVSRGFGMIAEIWKKRGREEGKARMNQEWKEWNQRREKAEKAGQRFNEPTPDEKAESAQQSR